MLIQLLSACMSDVENASCFTVAHSWLKAGSFGEKLVAYIGMGEAQQIL